MKNYIRNAIRFAAGYKYSNEYFMAMALANGGCFDDQTKNEFISCLLFNRMHEKETASVVDKEETNFSTAIIPNPAELQLSKIPTFLGRAFYKGLRTILYSASGVGKSLMSIAVGASLEFKKPFFILVDSDGDEDLPRYTASLKERSAIITLKDFQEKTENMEMNKNILATIQIKIMCDLSEDDYRTFRRVDNITNNIINRMGVRKNTQKPIDGVDVLLAIMTEAIEARGADLIVIDSLNSIVGDSRRLNRKVIRRITQKAAESHVTLLCLHHTNKAGTISGPGDISQAFDYVCRLSIDTTYSGGPNETVLILDEEKARYSKSQSFQIKRTFTNDLTPKYEVLEQHDYQAQQNLQKRPLNLTDRIGKVIDELEGSTVTFDELKGLLGGNPPPKDGSIRNSLKGLANAGMIRMTNGTWSVITKI